MRLKTITLIALMLAASGCTNTSALEDSISSLNKKVNNLTKQVNSLSSQTTAMSSEVTELGATQDNTNQTLVDTKMAVEKANERIDNMVASYKK